MSAGNQIIETNAEPSLCRILEPVSAPVTGTEILSTDKPEFSVQNYKVEKDENENCFVLGYN